MSGGEEPRRIICYVCVRSFPSLCALAAHENSTGHGITLKSKGFLKPQVYYCNGCEKVFRQACFLKQHCEAKNHSPFPSKDCDCLYKETSGPLKAGHEAVPSDQPGPAAAQKLVIRVTKPVVPVKLPLVSIPCFNEDESLTDEAEEPTKRAVKKPGPKSLPSVRSGRSRGPKTVTEKCVKPVPETLALRNSGPSKLPHASNRNLGFQETATVSRKEFRRSASVNAKGNGTQEKEIPFQSTRESAVVVPDAEYALIHQLESNGSVETEKSTEEPQEVDMEHTFSDCESMLPDSLISDIIERHLSQHEESMEVEEAEHSSTSQRCSDDESATCVKRFVTTDIVDDCPSCGSDLNKSVHTLSLNLITKDITLICVDCNAFIITENYYAVCF